MKIQPGNIFYEVADGKYDEVWQEINAGMWEPQTFLILDYFTDKEDVVLDLGAWIGAVSLYAAHLVSEVYAIEPDPVVFLELEKNALRNPGLKSKIKCRRLAISTKNEKLTLYARKQYGVSTSSLLPRIRDGLSSEQVQGITMKKFIESEKIKKVNYIKMDIEGGEFDLLPSIENDLIYLNFPTLFISFHYNYLREYQYRLKIKGKILSRLLMKLENWSGLELYGRTNKKIVLNCLRALQGYKFIYTESGQEISYSHLQSNPSIIKAQNLVFTNKKWVHDIKGG